MPRGDDRTWPALNREGMFRTPRAGVEFGDVVLTWYANQGDDAAGQPAAASSRTISGSASPISMPGSTSSRARACKFLDGPYTLGDTRAVMIEGPSREAMELVEV